MVNAISYYIIKVLHLPVGFLLGICAINSGVIILDAVALTWIILQDGWEIEAGYSATTGQQLWIANRTETPFTRASGQSGLLTGDGVYVEINLGHVYIIGYSLLQAQQLWTTVFPMLILMIALAATEMFLLMAVLYIWGFGGDICAINMATGAILWYTNTNAI